MNSRLLKVQSGFAAVLISAVIAEWGIGYEDHLFLQEKFKPLVAEDYEALQLPELDLSSQADIQLSDLVDRPLFIEGRKPIVEEAPAGSVVVDNGQLDDWELIGVYFKPNSPATALFRKRNEAKKYLKIKQNQSISGWMLKDIQGDRVILTQNGQEKNLMLLKPRPVVRPGASSKSAPAARPVQQPPVVQPNVTPSENIENES